MPHSRTMKVAVLALVVAMGDAFVAPTPRANNRPTTRTDRRVETSAVAPLNIAGFSFSSITDFFTSNREGVTSLPQDPKADQAHRKEQLEERKKEYRWSTEGPPEGTPYLEGFPPDDELPSVAWTTDLVASVLKIAVGTLRGSLGAGEIMEALTDPAKAKTFATRVRELIRENFAIDERPADIGDYQDLHAFPIKNPKSMYDWQDDEAFARLRLQGGNCVVLEKCTQSTREKLKVLDSDPVYKKLKSKVDSLMDEGKLFVVDHELLKDMEAYPIEGVERYLTPSVALFEVIDDDLLPIRPIGIQVVSHLGNTHVVLEAPMVAVNRCLPKEHPVYDLLKPHMEGTALINWGAQNLLIQPDNAVDILQANDIESSWDLVLEQVLKRIAGDFSPEADFASRQITKEDFPGRYPYRDYGMRYWEATHTWVKEYLDIYYKSDKDVEEDYELQAMIEELVDIGKVYWLKDYYTTDDKKALIAKVIASWIYSASTLHAAVNFPQKPSMSFVPSCPGSVYAPPPIDKRERTFDEFMNYLPPMEIATIHVAILTLLGDIFHTKLGQYETHNFDDDRIAEPLAKFQQAIEDIEDDLVADNADVVSGWRGRGKAGKVANNMAYTTLLPDNIPQSINI
ncbi:Lipoxygenase [Ectocarpus siliculosus]|uniref:Lipoxygenase n=1 Tax=Ectocarpus siliculosus TaxID=2880 RepID=D8LBX3_ECTSI|nr:Lipoxygenase [Ectocarpus siliculosus]|eukprot:CBN79156.1 Lipoxygenase [Ectocarpus siliculosus]